MKRFNVTGICVPEKHYMVDISGKIAEIKKNGRRRKLFYDKPGEAIRQNHDVA